MPTFLDFNNPLVVVAVILGAVLLLDLLMAGGGMTSCVACGVSGAMTTPLGWLGLFLAVALVWLALGAGLPAVGAGASLGADLVLLLLGSVLVAGLGLVALVVWQDRDRAPRRGSTPDEVLRWRYSRGELSREQYRQVLVDLLKDRYARGEIDLGAYEATLGRLLDEPRRAGAPGPDLVVPPPA